MTTLLALALAVRFIVPQGWMPSHVEGQVITICTGTDGMSQMVLGKDGKLHELPKGDHDKTDKPCAFAAMAMAASLPDVPMELLLPVRPDFVVGSEPASTIGQGLAAPPPPSTGPPILI